MKKLIALLIACVMSVGVLALCACADNNEDDTTTGDVDGRYPQIPEGVTLNDVKLSDAIDKEAELRQKRNASNNVIQDEYTYLNEVYYDEDSGKETRNYESEKYINLKYLNKDGKLYGENHQNANLSDKTNYAESENNENYEKNNKIDRTTFVQNNSLGVIYKGDYYSKNNGNEKEDHIPLQLRSYVVNGADVISKDEYYSGIKMLAYSYANSSDDGVSYLPYSVDEVKANTEYKLSQQEDPRYLYLSGNKMPIDFYEYYHLQYRDVKIKNYKSTFKADGSKMFFEYSYRADFKNFNNDKTFYSWEYKYATYLDTDAELTENDFKDNYLTDEVLTYSYYYDCDKEQVAADFMAGKDVVINPVGGADVSDVNLSYEEVRGGIYISPYVLFVDGNKKVKGYIAGYVNDSHAKVENGKVVINSEGALDVAKDYATHILEEVYVEAYGYDSIDFENAKMYLVINDDYIRDYGIIWGVVQLYIPLN